MSKVSAALAESYGLLEKEHKQLRAENAKLREALEFILEEYCNDGSKELRAIADIVRTALKGEG